MRAFMICIAVLGCSGLAFFKPAHADSLAAATGVDSNSAPGTCFSWEFGSGAVGLRNPNVDFCLNHYYMPLYWRTFYSASTNRVITVRGRRADASSELGCVAYVYDAAGNIVSQSGKMLPVTGANYGEMTLTVNNVAASGTTVLACTPKLNAWLLKANWNP